MKRISAAARAFREPPLISDIWQDKFYEYDARLFRYSLYWAFFENTPYVESALHSWAIGLKSTQGTYRHIRAIYNIAPRLGTFWQTYLLGGDLDMDAGDGEPVPSAIPIITENDDLRPAIAKIWQWSNWQQRKDIISLYGTTMGDCGIRIVDNTEKRRVYMQIIHPAMIVDLVKDEFGHVKAYELIDVRRHPETGQEVEYVERCYRQPDSDEIFYQTFLDGKLYPWNGETAEWSIGYGFVPFVHIPHNDVGKAGGGYGWAEIHQGWRKIVETDDAGSLIHDQIRKVIQPKWILTGGAMPSGGIRLTQQARSTDKPYPDREREDVLEITAPDAKMQPMIAPLNIADAGAEKDKLIQELEREYPEIGGDDLKTASGDASGRALRIARQKVEAKVRLRRAAYHRGLIHAQQMAVAIAGERGYDHAFSRFGLRSYAQGTLDHTIGPHPIFAADVLEKREAEKLFWENVTLATEAGLPLAMALAANGWSPDKIAEFAQQQRRTRIEEIRQQARQQAPVESQGEEDEGVPTVEETTEVSEEMEATA